MTDRHSLLDNLGERIQAHASEQTRRWWERYLRGQASFRGAAMKAVRSELHGWYRAHDLDDRSPRDQASLAVALIRRPMTEDKLAGILFLQEILIPLGEPSCRELTPSFEGLFSDGHLSDWNSVDWFAVKVLGPLIRRDGEPCARAISGWRATPVLWQRRAGAVAFVGPLHDGELFAGMYDEVIACCETLVASTQRFSQTGAGWVLRELSEADPDRVIAFIRTHRSRMSRDALTRAVAKLPAAVQAEILG
jgi:3-methyladenine DNA glycosylase AlkD